MTSLDYFRSDHYQRHNQRRQEHLATLGLPLDGKTVLEVGSGIGDHTSFFLDRGCKVTSTEGRPELLSVIQSRHDSVATVEWDAEIPPPKHICSHQIVYCYGILYHVNNPMSLLANLANLTTDMLLLETCVSFGDQHEVNLVKECPDDPTQALNGEGCRPTRPWIFTTLKQLFPFVYITRTQPWHEEFPIDWSLPATSFAGLARCVFVASCKPLVLGSLSDTLLVSQERC